MSDTNKFILTTRDLEIGFLKPPGKPNISLMKGISVKARKGELVAMIGQNGIGKSTLLRTLVQLHPALSGNVILNNKNIEKYTRQELARQLGFVSTEIINAGNLSVYDLVALGRFPYTNWLGNINNEDRFMIDHSIELVDLAHKRDKMLTEISDGERQRAMIARTLSQDTDLLILDEPTAFLDLPNRYEVLKLLRDLSCKGKTIIFSTHDLNLVIDQVDKIWMMTEGGMIEGAPEDLILSDSFNSVFPGSSLIFNKESGRFDYPADRLHEVYIEGEGELKAWTAKAMERKGYLPIEKGGNAEISVKVYMDNGQAYWELKTKNAISVYKSIYELMFSL